MTTVEAGLFVGVDSYDAYGEDLTLHVAREDALRLYDYFRGASPVGRWECLVENAVRRPLRVEFFDALHRLAGSLKQKCAGLLYFAGHAAAGQDGLVLTTCDTRPGIAYDSGVPLQRLFRILGEETGKMFFVVLDCCRAGTDNPQLDPPPANVCVLYACPGGADSSEAPTGGMLTSAVLRSVKRVASHQRLGTRICTVQRLQAELARTLLCSPEYFSLLPEFRGECGDRLYLPLARRQGRRSNDVEQSPTCYLETVSIDRRQIARYRQEMLNEIEMSVQGWKPGQRLADCSRDLASRGAEPSQLRVMLPRGGAFVGPSRFLENMLSRFPDIFQRLTMEWSGPLSIARLRQVARILPGARWTREIEGHLYVLSWQNQDAIGETTGQGWVDRTQGSRTLISIACTTSENEFASLYRLLPTLPRLYDVLHRTGVREGGG